MILNYIEVSAVLGLMEVYMWKKCGQRPKKVLLFIVGEWTIVVPLQPNRFTTVVHI